MRNYKEHAYFESTETTFKKHYTKHKKSFDLIRFKNNTKLFKYIGELSHVKEHQISNGN